MKYFRKRKKSRDKSGFLNFHVKERTKFFCMSFGESSKGESSKVESSQNSLKGKNEKRKKWKMVEAEKSDLNPSGGDDPSDKPSSSGTGSETGSQWKSEVSKESFYIREDGVKLHKIPEDGWSEYPPTRILHDFCTARCIKKPEIYLIDADGEAHCPVFTFQ